MRLRKGLARKWVILMVVLGAALVTLGATAFFYTGIGPYDLPPKSRELEKTIAESKKLGLPMTKEELLGPVPPTEQNAAPKVTSAIQSFTKEVTSRMAPSVDVTPGNVLERGTAGQARRNYIADVSPDLDAIVAGLKGRPDWYVDRDYDRGAQLYFVDLARAKEVAKALAVRSVLRAGDGDTQGCTEDLIACRSLAHHIAQEPALIAMLVAFALDDMALVSVTEVANQWKDDPQKLAKLEDCIKRSNEAFNIVPALRGEFYSALCTTRNLNGFGGIKALTAGGMAGGEPSAIDPSTIVRSGLPKGMFERASFEVVAQHWNSVFAAFQNEKPPYRSWSGPITKWEQKAESRFRASEVFALVSAPMYSLVDESLTASDAYPLLAIVFVRCMRYRAEHKEWPSSLAAIHADFPDPFSAGESIKAKFGDGSLVVWSIGPNHKDDGGVHKYSPRGHPDDLAFRWPPSK